MLLHMQQAPRCGRQDPQGHAQPVSGDADGGGLAGCTASHLRARLRAIRIHSRVGRYPAASIAERRQLAELIKAMREANLID